MRWVLGIGFCLTASLAAAAPPSQSPRPVARPPTPMATPVTPIESVGVTNSLRPRPRPAKVDRAVKEARKLREKGAVCQDLALQGEEIGAVSGKLPGCGLTEGIRLREVAGVRLSQPAVTDCATAKALKKWVEKGLKPAVGQKGGGVEKLRVFASYSCRTRNSQKGAKISEHGKGRAIDIGGIILQDGQEITVLQDWGKGSEGKILKKAHKSACGPFGTVLGPNSDRFHKDHFHFDTARYRSGSYCR